MMAAGCSDPRTILPLMVTLLLLLVLPFILLPRRHRLSSHGERSSDAAWAKLDKASTRWPWNAYCVAESEDGAYGHFDWPKTYPIRTVHLDCPYGGAEAEENDRPTELVSERHPQARRKCAWKLEGRAKWDPADYSQCKAKPELTPEEAKQAVDDLVRDTDNPANIRSETFTNATETLHRVFPIALKNKEVARSMFKAVSNLLVTDRAVLAAGDADGKRSRRIVKLVDRYIASVPVDPDERHRLSYDNLDLHVHVQKEGDHMDNLFQPDFRVDNQVASLKVPGEAIRRVAQDDRVAVRVRFLALRNARFLKPPGELSADQVVISASLSRAKSSVNRTTRSVMESTSSGADEDSRPPEGEDDPEGLEESVRGLQEAVLVTMPWTQPGTTHSCFYYDPQSESWQNDGVLTKLTLAGVVCESSHLTAFSLLLDPFPRRDLGALREPLDMLSYVGSFLSTVGLGLTIITYHFSRLGRDRWGRVLVQLCLALFLLHIAFMMTGFKGWVPPLVCAGVAIYLHVSMLATLAWMLVEAVLLYQLLITVFQAAENYYVLKRMLVAWGLPVILVGATAAYDFRYYGDTHPDYCMTSGELLGLHWVVLVAPGAGVLLANIVIFTQVSRVLLRRRQPPGQRVGPAQPQNVTCAQIRGVVGVAFLLGLSWVLSPLSGRSAVMHVISTVANCFQGVIIFLSRVVFHPEARRTWRGFLCSTPEEPRVRSSASASYSLGDKGGLWSWFRWTTPAVPEAEANKPSKSSDKKGWWVLVQRRLSTPMQTSSTTGTSTEPQQLKVNK